MKPLILKQDLLAAFRELGMQPGMTMMVHTSLSSLGYVTGTRCSTLSIGLSSELQAVSTVSAAAAKRSFFVFIVYFVLLFYM